MDMVAFYATFVILHYAGIVEGRPSAAPTLAYFIPVARDARLPQVTAAGVARPAAVDWGALAGANAAAHGEMAQENEERMERELARLREREHRKVLTIAGVQPYVCDTGYECLPNPMAPGVMSCFSGIARAKAPGRCPPPSIAIFMSGASSPSCLFHRDCVEGERCCATGAARFPRCVPSLADVRHPRVVPLIVGGGERDDHRLRASSVTLVQSKGKNILVDTGTVADKPKLLRALRSYGLSLGDIDFVVVTHGHPDHFGNAAMFPAVPQSFYDVNILAEELTVKWKPGIASPRYFVFNDRNVEVVKCEGHTLQDTAVLVRNVPNRGTVVVSGDAFLYNNDHIDGSAVASAQNKAQIVVSRRKLLCTADWIVPGHGPMFSVTKRHTSAFRCA